MRKNGLEELGSKNKIILMFFVIVALYTKTTPLLPLRLNNDIADMSIYCVAFTKLAFNTSWFL